jgi:uncharacterized membrane protein
MGIKKFSEQDQEEIKKAIRAAEFQTSGEIRVFVEAYCTKDVLDRAAFQFKQLEMHKTEQRNGVLIYLATEDHKFAVIGDVGINRLTGPAFWHEAKEAMLLHFKNDDLKRGLIEGIHLVGEAMKKHFPYLENDKNELPDDIAFN